MASKYRVGDEVQVRVGQLSDIRDWNGKCGVVRRVAPGIPYPYRVGFGRGTTSVSAVARELTWAKTKKTKKRKK